MNKSMETNEQRKLRSVARRYKRDGYRVTMPARGETVPTFLEGFTPDLIAESDHDRVVVEIKQSHALRGSNDIQEVAERVSRQPGWRFELVTVPSIEGVSRPAAERMEFIANRVRQAMNVGLTDMAYTYAWSFIEALLNELAVRRRLKARQMPIMHVGRELVVQGSSRRKCSTRLNRLTSSGTKWLMPQAISCHPLRTWRNCFRLVSVCVPSRFR